MFYPKAGKRCHKAGKILLLVLLGCWLFISITGSFWMGLWIRRYEPLHVLDLPQNTHYVIAVAGYDFIPDLRIPPECRFSGRMLERLAESVRIARQMELKKNDYEIVVSTFEYKVPVGLIDASLFAYFNLAGINSAKVSVIKDAGNTRQEIRRFAKYRGTKILVSNAPHIPRLMLLARKYDIPAIAAPANYINREKKNLLNISFYPSGKHVNDFERLCYALLGSLEVLLF
ncbi:MAG: ElyC/SanA/YdcF family protein [Lentisphaeria bacterium]